MTTTADVLPTIVLPQAPDDATKELYLKRKMAGDSERRCVLSIIERGMVLFIKASVLYWFGFFMFLLRAICHTCIGTWT
jgi:hypothetical protein